MLPWKLQKFQILPINQNFSSGYFSLAKFQFVSCNLSRAMIWQMTYTHKLPKLCSAILTGTFLPLSLWYLLFLWISNVLLDNLSTAPVFSCNQMNNLKTFTVCTLYIIESVLATSVSFQRPCCFNGVILSNIRNAVVIQNCFCKSSPFDSAMREPSLSEHVTKPSKQLIDVQKTQVSTERGRGCVLVITAVK